MQKSIQSIVDVKLLNFCCHFLGFFLSLGKSPDDDVRLSALNLKPNNKIMMMGTREENLVGL